ncbi:MAG TPA: hypothetical protein VNO23_14560, partial [Candidatus Binatia bacterium]|nr:hypothetical protein [Candidatus Binatia bacterium]
MELYTRRQLVLLLGLLGAALAGLGVAHWRARHPDLVDRLEQWDRAPSRADRSTARRSVSGAEDEAGGAGEAADPGRGAAEPLGSLEVPRHRPVKLPSAPTGEPPPGPLDLNRAGPEELVRLPGVGPAL